MAINYQQLPFTTARWQGQSPSLQFINDQLKSYGIVVTDLIIQISF